MTAPNNENPKIALDIPSVLARIDRMRSQIRTIVNDFSRDTGLPVEITVRPNFVDSQAVGELDPVRLLTHYKVEVNAKLQRVEPL